MRLLFQRRMMECYLFSLTANAIDHLYLQKKCKPALYRIVLTSAKQNPSFVQKKSMLVSKRHVQKVNCAGLTHREFFTQKYPVSSSPLCCLCTTVSDKAPVKLVLLEVARQ